MNESRLKIRLNPSTVWTDICFLATVPALLYYRPDAEGGATQKQLPRSLENTHVTMSFMVKLATPVNAI